MLPGFHFCLFDVIGRAVYTLFLYLNLLLSLSSKEEDNDTHKQSCKKSEAGALSNMAYDTGLVTKASVFSGLCGLILTPRVVEEPR